MRAVVLGGSRGIGYAIAESLSKAGCDVFAASKADVDTSDLESVKKFASMHPETDVLVLNTGGPPPAEFDKVSENDWQKYHNQLFLGFCLLVRQINITDGGYLFVISSSVIKEPSARLAVSGAYRSAFASIFRLLSVKLAKRDITCVTILPGPTNTDRTRELVDDVDKFAADLPMGRLGEPKEIGDMIKSIVKNNIKYVSGAMISFDGGASKYIH
ncbi:MAG: short-chain alcohol dehydrogenase [Cenarchaeum symbiont of Oopsacas minuta]|nr:short-chain alcohol dehydrogenase [Cenarchaeum symbiont of Oopsacas minuta]